MVRIVPKNFANHSWSLDANCCVGTHVNVSDKETEKASFRVVRPGPNGNGTLALRPLSMPNGYVITDKE